MSVSDAKAALDACKKGVEIMKTQQLSNQALVNDDNERNRAWEARKNAADTILASWANKTGNYIRFKDIAYQRIAGSGQCWGRPRGNGNDICRANAYTENLPYPNDWIDVGGDSCCKDCGWAWAKDTFNCGRSQESINNATNEYNNAKPIFTETKPIPNSQNTTPVNIACCSNEVKVIGSEVIGTTINQENDCLRSKEAAVVSAESSAAKASQDAAAAAASNASAAKVAKNDNTNDNTNSMGGTYRIDKKSMSAADSTAALKKSDNKKLFITFIIIIMIIISISSCVSLLLIAL